MQIPGGKGHGRIGGSMGMRWGWHVPFKNHKMPFLSPAAACTTPASLR